MWIFIWTATEKAPCSSRAFSCYLDAWTFFKGMRVEEFPHHILHMPSDTNLPIRAYNWPKFVDLGSQTRFEDPSVQNLLVSEFLYSDYFGMPE